jgi:hypothetical protein
MNIPITEEELDQIFPPDVATVGEEKSEEKIYLLQLDPWEWGKTDGLDGEDFYDYSPDGRLFSSAATCPLCFCKGSLQVSAPFGDGCFSSPTEGCCAFCGAVMDIVFSWGAGHLIQRTPTDDHYVSLPTHVVAVHEWKE